VAVNNHPGISFGKIFADALSDQSLPEQFDSLAGQNDSALY